MICSSLNLDRFIVRPLPGVGPYEILEEIQGLQSQLRSGKPNPKVAPCGRVSCRHQVRAAAIGVNPGSRHEICPTQPVDPRAAFVA